MRRPGAPRTRRTWRLALALALAMLPSLARAQTYRALDVPDSSLAGTLAAHRSDYESLWNALFVSGLRSGLARADSTGRLVGLAGRVARAESLALGSRIGLDALALNGRWRPDQRRQRVRAAVTESLAVASRAAHDFQTAIVRYREALGDYRALGERRREAWVVGGMAAAALLARQYPQAESLYHEALGLRRTLGDPRLIGNTLNDLGQVYFQLGRFDEARPCLAEARQLRLSTGQRAAVWNTLSYLGLTLEALGQPDSAALCFDEALGITSQLGDSVHTFQVLANLMALYMDRSDPRTLVVGKRALSLARSQEDAAGESQVDHNLAEYMRRAGHYTEAIDAYREAVRLEADQPPERVLSLNGLASTYEQVGDPERARRVLEQAVALADSLDSPSIRATVLISLSVVLGDLDDHTGATRCAARALDDAVTSGDSARVHDASEALAELAYQRGDLAEAEHRHLRSRDAGEHLDLERRLADNLNLALVRHLLGRWDEAEREYLSVLATARVAGLEDAELTAITNLGDLAERRGDLRAALARYGEAAAVIDSARTHQSEGESIKLYARSLFVIDATVHLLGKLHAQHPDSGYSERAFALAEGAHARSLLDRLATPGSGSAPRPLGLREAQAALGSNRMALLEYSVGDSSTTLWVVRRSGWHAFTLPRRAALKARIQALRRGFGDPEAATAPATRAAQFELYRMLVAPADSALAGVDRLVIVPDGLVALVPFEALITRAATPDPKPADYLLSRFDVSYAPSASVLAALADRESAAAKRAGHAARGPILALGDPWFGQDDTAAPGADRPAPERQAEADSAGLGLPRLPSSGPEAALLGRLAKGRHADVLLGRDATRARLLPLLPHAQLVHLATHGEVNEVEPDRSVLWLAAGESGRPGRLEAGDVLGLRLDAELVTLSACQTGLGRIERGEGVVGLARAFLASGSRSVIASLWSVNDRSTTELMRRFYVALLEHGRDRDVALADAKRALLQDPATRSPHFWAPFVLIGESGPLR